MNQAQQTTMANVLDATTPTKHTQLKANRQVDNKQDGISSPVTSVTHSNSGTPSQSPPSSPHVNEPQKPDPVPTPTKHACTLCGKTFKRAHNLKIHGRLHNDDRPYVCPFAGCDKGFRWKSSIVSHINWHRTKKGQVLPPEVLLSRSQFHQGTQRHRGRGGRLQKMGQLHLPKLKPNQMKKRAIAAHPERALSTRPRINYNLHQPPSVVPSVPRPLVSQNAMSAFTKTPTPNRIELGPVLSSQTAITPTSFLPVATDQTLVCRRPNDQQEYLNNNGLIPSMASLPVTIPVFNPMQNLDVQLTQGQQANFRDRHAGDVIGRAEGMNEERRKTVDVIRRDENLELAGIGIGPEIGVDEGVGVGVGVGVDLGDANTIVAMKAGGELNVLEELMDEIIEEHESMKIKRAGNGNEDDPADITFGQQELPLPYWDRSDESTIGETAGHEQGRGNVIDMDTGINAHDKEIDMETTSEGLLQWFIDVDGVEYDRENNDNHQIMTMTMDMLSREDNENGEGNAKSWIAEALAP